jgi:patatin-like phospholipase/acyl hydrolase
MANEETSRFQILALSGGGYKGLYTATIIADFEEHTGCPFASHFDLLSGTSIGGILTLALASKIPAKQIVELLKSHGESIFTPLPDQPFYRPLKKKLRSWTGFDTDRGLKKAKHSNVALKKLLIELFDKRTIGDLEHRVLIPAVNWTKGGPQFFKTPHHPRFTRDKTLSLVDVAMATSAAPIFLPNYVIKGQVYVDGGLVGNAPGLFALHEAETNLPAAKNSEIFLLSIGALSAKVTANQEQSVDRGLLDWGENLISLMMASQEGVTDFMLKQKLGDHNYHKIDEFLSPEQSKTINLDITTQGATEALEGLGNASAQTASGNEFVSNILNHTAPTPIFHTAEGK